MYELAGQLICRLPALLLAALIGACGGGGGSAATSASPPPATPPPPPPANSAPTISGTPQTSVAQDEIYQFSPTATDSDGDSLLFSISNRPAWASFDVDSGRLTGTPVEQDVGTTNAVTITVSDGSLSAALTPFDLEVLAAPLGSATISWDKPTTNADGSLLTDLAGFRVHYGESPQTYGAFVAIDDGNTTTAEIDGLAVGTWYFAVTAVDQAGNQSAFSTEVSKAVLP